MQQIIYEQEVLRRSKCRICNESVKVDASDNSRITCKNIACPLKGKKIHIWANTIFHNCKQKKTKILRIIELWIQKASKNMISYETNLDEKTIWRILKKLATHIVPSYYNGMEELGGIDHIIEIDESKFGKRKYNRGHHVDGVWILGMVDRTTNKVKVVQVEDRRLETLSNKITDSISNQSTIYTDGWKGYNALKNSFSAHLTVNHSKHFKDPITQVHTNKIEGTWAGIKMHVPPRGRTKALINLYLIRYMIIKNENGHPFEALIKYLF